MITRTLALVVRALRVDARDIRPHLFRFALVASVFFLLIQTYMDQFYIGAPGLALFKFMMSLNYWFVTVAGATFFATSITEEKEEKTLGLMKMAGVSGLSIIAGKWMPRLIGACLLILIQIPFTVLAITLGGVSWHQIGAAYLCLLAHLFFVGNLGLLASVLSPKSTSASGMVVALLFAYHIMPPMLSSAASSSIANGVNPFRIVETIETASNSISNSMAIYRLVDINATGFSGSWFDQTFLANSIAGLVLLLLSWLLFEPMTRNEVVMGESKFVRWVRMGGVLATKKRSWNLAFVGKDFHYLAGGWLLLSVKLIAYFMLVIVTAFYMSSWNLNQLDREYFGWTSIGLFWVLLVVESAVIVTRVYRAEMVEHTWPVAIMVPKSMPEIAYQKLAGGMMALLPAFALMFVGCVLIPEEVLDVIGDFLTDADFFLVFSYFVLQVVLGLHLACYLSITARWAVWPLAIFMGAFVIFMWNFMMIACFSSMRIGGGDEEGIFFLLCAFTSGLIITAHVLIGSRLTQLASE